MLNIGSHLSISKGFYAIGRDALSIGANTFQFFTRNPRGGSARKIDIEDVNALIKLMTENNFAKILAHAPYTMNTTEIQYFRGFFINAYDCSSFFCSFSICLILFSGVGRSSGIVPPSSAMVCLTFFPTS